MVTRAAAHLSMPHSVSRQLRKSATRGYPPPPKTSIGRSPPLGLGLPGDLREKASGKATKGRHQLEKAIDALGTGDVLVVAEWDRATKKLTLASLSQQQ